MQIEYIDLQPPSRDVLLAADIAGVLVDEQGHPDDDSTLMKAFLSLCFIDYRRRRPPSMIYPVDLDPLIDRFRQRYRRIPSQLSMMVSTIARSEDPRLLADIRAVRQAVAREAGIPEAWSF